MDDSKIPDGAQQSRDILKEMADVNRQAQEQSAFRKTTSWHLQPSGGQAPGQAGQLERVIQLLERIEKKIDALAKEREA